MEDEIEQILKNTNKQGQKIAIGNLRHKPRGDNKVIDEQTINRLKNLKKYVLHDTSIPTETLNNYYCSLCGNIALVTNVLIDNLPKRKTDKAIAIDLRSNFIKLNLQKDKIRHLLRQKGLETYYRWKCECGVPVGYSCMTYQQLEAVRLGEQYTGSVRPFFYVFDDALVEKMKESKLISELITYKETILLHLKRKTKK